MFFCWWTPGHGAGGQTEALLQRSDGLRGGHLLQRGAGLRAASVGESLSDGHVLWGGENTGREKSPASASSKVNRIQTRPN